MKSLNSAPCAANCAILLHKRLLSGLILVLLVSACATRPQETAPAPSPDSADTEIVAIPRDELYTLLDQADQAIERDHLTYPEEGSAYGIYQSILDRDPTQSDAQRGLEHVVEKYVELAMSALDRGQYATARSMLARARIILPDHPSIEPTERQIRLLSQAQRTQVKLSQKIIDGPPQSLETALGDIASTPAGTRCRYTIWARNDRQGRHIYQVLSASISGRLPAQIEVRSPAGVERLCFSE